MDVVLVPLFLTLNKYLPNVCDHVNTEAAVRRCSSKDLFLKTCVSVSF